MKHKVIIFEPIFLSALLLSTSSPCAWAAFPPVHSNAIVFDDKDSYGGSATLYMWAEGGSLYLHVKLRSLSFLPAYFYVLQDNEQYESIFLDSESGLYFESLDAASIRFAASFDGNVPDVVPRERLVYPGDDFDEDDPCAAVK